MVLSTVVCLLLLVDIPPWILKGGSVVLGPLVMYSSIVLTGLNLAVYDLETTHAIILLP